jgi:hypothetical protein
MRKILLMIMLFLATLSLNAQNTMTKVDDNLYEIRTHSSSVSQIGTMKIVNNEWIRHGIWVMKINGKFNSKGVYENDKLVRLTINTKEGLKTFKKSDLKIMRLERQIYKLEKMLSYRD